MSTVNARPAFLQHVVTGLVLVGVVVFLTICFNILGNLGCSILTGMMLGAKRQWKWQLLLVSLVFPGAILGLLQFSRGDLVAHSRIVLAVVCWAAFVMAYLAGYLVVCLEKHPKSETEESERGRSDSLEGSTIHAVTETAAVGGPASLELNIVQGQWLSESLPLNGDRQRRVLEVTGDELVLWVTDAKGHLTCQAKGRLKLE